MAHETGLVTARETSRAVEGARVRTVCVIGLGYVGLPTASMLARAGLRVTGVDLDRAVVDAVNAGEARGEEHGLAELVGEVVAGGQLRATPTPVPADAFVIAVPTPLRSDGTHGPDLSRVRAAGIAIAPSLKRGDLVVLESTSPVGTTAMLAGILADARPDLSFPHEAGEGSDIRLAYCPERVVPGRMLHELVHNDRIIGGMTRRCAASALALYGAFAEGECRLTDDRTAEMVKLAENAFRDVNLAFANELSMVCYDLGLDPWRVIELANRHPRVSILNPGPGVGGHCVAVDPWFIVASAPERATLVRTAREVNDAKARFVVEQVREAARGMERPTIACLGLAYKPDVDDFRDSPALEIAGRLAELHPGRVVCADPHAAALPRRTARRIGTLVADAADAVAGADIVVLLTGHTAFRALSITAGTTVIDTCGLWR